MTRIILKQQKKKLVIPALVMAILLALSACAVCFDSADDRGSALQVCEIDIHYIMEDFLSEFPSIFSLGRLHDGEFVDWDWGRGVERLDAAPLVYVESDLFHNPDSNYFNGRAYFKNGELVGDDAPFMRHRLIARDFLLFDFENDGISEILIRFTADTWSFWTMYRFIDGEYRLTDSDLYWQRFYANSHGEIFVFEADHGYTWLSRMTFTERGVEYEFAGSFIPPDFDSLKSEFDIDGRIFPNMPDERFTPILPLTELRDELFETVSRRLGVK